MESSESLVLDVARALKGLEVPFMLVGAAALAVRGVTRGSHDVDFMATERKVLSEDWATLIPPPVTFEILRGDLDDPLAGTVRFFRESVSPVDLVVAKWKWQAEVIGRSEWIDLETIRIRVPSVDDLVLLKLEAGSYLDQRDAAQLIEVHGEDVVNAIFERIHDLPDSLGDSVRRFLSDVNPNED